MPTPRKDQDGRAGHSRLTVAEALDQYAREHKVGAPERRQYAIDHLTILLGSKPLAAVDIPLCRWYKQQRRVKDATTRRELGVLQAAANHALRWRRIAAADMPSIELPPNSDPRMLWLFEDELQRLRDAATGRARLFIDLAYYTASRKGALENLTWDRVNLNVGRIALNDPCGRLNKKRKPVVPIAPELIDKLKLLKSATAYVGPAEFGGQCRNYVLSNTHDIRPAFDAAAHRAGLEMLPARDGRPAGRLTPHVLRHTRATHLLQKGVDPYAVAALLGDNLSTVLRVYGHHCPGYLEEAIR